MSKKTYIVESYDPATRKIERVTVTHEVYNAYRLLWMEYCRQQSVLF